MKIKIICLCALLGLLSMGTLAEDENLHSRLDEIKGQIKTEEEANQKLKDDLTTRDKMIADLKQKLKELEDQTAKQSK